jgi:hypothetical protein
MIAGGCNASKPLPLRNKSVPYPHQKTQGLPHAKFIEEVYSKREPVQNPRVRYFKPFEFFDHTGSGVKWLNLQDPDGNPVLLVQV